MDKYIELDFAKLDTDRVKRRGYSEAVFCECKNDEQLIKIFQSFKDIGFNVIGTRCSKNQYEILKNQFGEIIKYNEQGRVVTLIQKKNRKNWRNCDLYRRNRRYTGCGRSCRNS